MNPFFQRNTFIIDQKTWTIANSYRILGEDGQQIGVIQENLPASRLILSFFISKKNLPFTLHLQDAAGNIMATIEKKFSFFVATIDIKDGNGIKIGTIKQKFTLLSRHTRSTTPPVSSSAPSLATGSHGTSRSWTTTRTNSPQSPRSGAAH